MGLGFQFFLEMTYKGFIYHIQKDSRSLDDPPPTMIDFFIIFHWSEPLTQFVSILREKSEALMRIHNFLLFAQLQHPETLKEMFAEICQIF